MKRVFSVIVEQDENGHLTAIVPELVGCHTQASNIDELMERLKEVVELCMEDKGGFRPLKSIELKSLEVECA